MTGTGAGSRSSLLSARFLCPSNATKIGWAWDEAAALMDAFAAEGFDDVGVAHLGKAV